MRVVLLPLLPRGGGGYLGREKERLLRLERGGNRNRQTFSPLAHISCVVCLAHRNFCGRQQSRAGEKRPSYGIHKGMVAYCRERKELEYHSWSKQLDLLFAFFFFLAQTLLFNSPRTFFLLAPFFSFPFSYPSLPWSHS